ncbi:MAG: phosphotransferase [Bacteroidetes bacterium]|jgi:fructosamine-3-kinase|nr:phosphotransferase [Bacteroidota bacterium]
MIPQDIREALSEGWDIHITAVHPVSGGCINQAYEVETAEGAYFLKINGQEPADFFQKEAAGLDELRSAGTELIIPEVIAVRDPAPAAAGFLLMEFIPAQTRGDAAAFGAQLARLHGHTQTQFGFMHDNYIGSLPQANANSANWIDFFCQQRIEPLLKKAIDDGKVDSNLRIHWDRLAHRLDQLIPKCEPSLLHGDLWSGNYIYDTQGRAVLIDPAVYYGHPEMDLAFSHMFGGFSAAFYEGYEAVSPLEPGFEERVDIHNLYPLLVHVNLFGGHYANQLRRVLVGKG